MTFFVAGVCEQAPSVSSINRILRTRAAERTAEELSLIINQAAAASSASHPPMRFPPLLPPVSTGFLFGGPAPPGPRGHPFFGQLMGMPPNFFGAQAFLAAIGAERPPGVFVGQPPLPQIHTNTPIQEESFNNNNSRRSSRSTFSQGLITTYF